MDRIQRQIDALVVRLKHQDAMAGIRFVREYANAEVETPVRGFLAVVGMTDASRRNMPSREKGYIGGYLTSSVCGEAYSAHVEIRVYAPQSENGSGLSEAVSELLEGLKEADEEMIITAASASSIEFDPDTNAIFRKVDLTIAFCLCEEG